MKSPKTHNTPSFNPLSLIDPGSTFFQTFLRKLHAKFTALSTPLFLTFYSALPLLEEAPVPFAMIPLCLTI